MAASPPNSGVVELGTARLEGDSGGAVRVVAVRLTARDEPLAELEMSCTTSPRQEFDLALDRKVEVTLTARSENAEGRAELFRIG